MQAQPPCLTPELASNLSIIQPERWGSCQAQTSHPGHPTSIPVLWEGGPGQLPVPLKDLGQVSVLTSLPHPNLGLAFLPRLGLGPIMLALVIHFPEPSEDPLKGPEA